MELYVAENQYRLSGRCRATCSFHFINGCHCPIGGILHPEDRFLKPEKEDKPGSIF
jgi:hypothetical protein